MAKMYNVLWLEDEPEKLDGFIESARKMNLEISHYYSAEEVLKAISSNISKWDAVILDVNGYEDINRENFNQAGFANVKDYINRLNKKIPIFVFSGQDKLMENPLFNLFVGGTYYKKSNGFRPLFESILYEISQNFKNQIKANYEGVFAALESLKIIDDTEEIFLNILLPLHYKEKEVDFNAKIHYTQLRKAIEYLFRSCNKVGLVPDLCISNGKVNLNQSSLYLAGKPAENLNIICCQRIIPEYIESIIRSILVLGNTASHTVDLNEQDKEKVDNPFKSLNSNYLIYGFTLQLCEVVVWFANYISENGDRETNLKLCKKIIEDEVKTYIGKEITPNIDADGKPYWDKCLLHNSAKDKKIKITGIELNGNSKTSNMYKYFAKFEIVSD